MQHLIVRFCAFKIIALLSLGFRNLGYSTAGSAYKPFDRSLITASNVLIINYDLMKKIWLRKHLQQSGITMTV